MGGERPTFNRRGMSPLIATVLLMAFAVALGGMIMNLSIDLGKDKACGELTVKINQFCSRGNQIDLRLALEKDSHPLQGLKVEIADQGVENSLTIKDSDVPSGGRLEIGIPVSTSSNAIATIIPVVGSPSAPYVCTDTPLFIADPLPPC